MLFAAAAQVSATDKAVTTATFPYIRFALEAELLVPMVQWQMIRSVINRRQNSQRIFFHDGYLLGTVREHFLWHTWLQYIRLTPPEQ